MKRRLMTNPLLCIFSTLLILNFSSCTQLKKLNHSQHCFEKRSALKIELKKVIFIKAKIDSCYNKLHHVLAVQEVPFNFKFFLKDKFTSADFKPSEQLQSFISSKINQSKSSGTPIKIVASSIFSTDQYSKLIPSLIEQAFNQKVYLFSKEQEANEYYLAYLASLKKAEQTQGIWYLDDHKNIIVTPDSSSTLEYYSSLNPNFLRKQIIAWKGSRGSSPYPIGAFNARRATEFSEDSATQFVSQEMKESLIKSKLNGISPIHNLIARNLKTLDEPYSRYQLEGLAKSRISRSADIEYEENDIAALLLILGHMRALKINTVKPLKVEPRAGILFHSALW
jgi:hypothetical protein